VAALANVLGVSSTPSTTSPGGGPGSNLFGGGRNSGQ